MSLNFSGRMWRIFSLWALVVLIYSCGNEKSSTPSSPASTSIRIPNFNADSAYAFLEDQLAFGYRVPGTQEHLECGNYLVDKLSSFDVETTKQPFKTDFLGRTDVSCFNILGSINPDHPTRIILAAHWDSRAIAEKESDPSLRDNPIRGADDGASGVAVILEIARTLQENPIDLGIDIIFFDAEDQGESGSGDINTWALGAQYWSRQILNQNYNARYGILLDMVGSKNASFGKEDISVRFAGDIVDKIWTLAARMGYSDYFQNWNAGAVTDDHYFVNTVAKIPMIDIINISSQDRRSFGHYHHTNKDDIDIIDKRTLKVVGQVVTAALFREAEGVL